MADDPKISNVFSVRELITMPLEAVIDANIAASEAAIKFLREYGFVPPPSGPDPLDWGELRMVTFEYYFVTGGTRNHLEVRLPLLSLIPLPLLTIDRASFEIGMHVLNHIVTPPNPEVGPLDAAAPDVSPPTTFGMLAPARESVPPPSGESFTPYSYNRLQANIVAQIDVVSSDLPPGILSLLNLLQNAGESITPQPYALTPTPEALRFVRTPAGDRRELAVTVRSLETGEPVANVQVHLAVASSTGQPLDSVFAAPIEVLVGRVVGVPTLGSASALTDGEGRVVVALTSLAGSSDNGFVSLSCKDVVLASVYYVTGADASSPPPSPPPAPA